MRGITSKMPITALPQATVQLLGSSQVLTSPTSLVKELIDNALDAKATSIDILISKNTLDKLEVRDNGHGIPCEDYSSLGKRGHTSKLRTFEELKFIGGLTLGFRGEALASAVELGDVTVTTRAEGEAVGTKLVLKAPGAVNRESRTSHPVGTTVSVLKFMYNLPVRRTTLEKEAPKTLSRINQLLRSYALARPSIRFGFKITNGGRGAWSFVPHPRGGIREAISAVIGRDAAMECIEKSVASSEKQTTNSTVPFGDQKTESSVDGNAHSDDGCFSIDAVLPKFDADISKVGTGQYLSIDSRPVSHEKGTMKKIVVLFKKYIREALADTSEKLKSPFLRLDIKCPAASYDANVEPAKDDVLFGNEQIVLDLAESLLKEVYGVLKPVLLSSTPIPLAQKLDDYDLLRARISAPNPVESPSRNETPLPQRSPSSSSVALGASYPVTRQSSSIGGGSEPNMDDVNSEQIGSAGRKWGLSISDDFSEEVDEGRPHARHGRNPTSMPQQTPDRELSKPQLNPWTIAKLTAPINHNGTTHGSDCTIHRPLSDVISSSQLRPLDVPNAFTPPSTRPRQTFRSDDTRTLQPSVSQRYSASAVRPDSGDEMITEDAEIPVPRRKRNDFISARNVPQDALVSPPSSLTQPQEAPPRARGPRRPFVSPLATVGRSTMAADRLIQTALFANKPRPRRNSASGPVISQNELNEELAWAMDFEQRKEDASRRRREEIHAVQPAAEHASSSTPVRSSPHKNRYNAAIATLQTDQARIGVSNTSRQPKHSFKTTLPGGDPRTYLMKCQKSMAAEQGASGGRPVMMRAKSTRLPLEKTPQNEHLHKLILIMATNMKKIHKSMDQMAKEDTYIRGRNQFAGLAIRSTETPLVARKLQEIVSLWMDGHEEIKCEVEYNFGNLLSSDLLST